MHLCLMLKERVKDKLVFSLNGQSQSGLSRMARRMIGPKPFGEHTISQRERTRLVIL